MAGAGVPGVERREEALRLVGRAPRRGRALLLQTESNRTPGRRGCREGRCRREATVQDLLLDHADQNRYGTQKVTSYSFRLSFIRRMVERYTDDTGVVNWNAVTQKTRHLQEKCLRAFYQAPGGAEGSGGRSAECTGIFSMCLYFHDRQGDLVVSTSIPGN